jgi:hypothetical protein
MGRILFLFALAYFSCFFLTLRMGYLRLEAETGEPAASLIVYLILRSLFLGL